MKLQHYRSDLTLNVTLTRPEGSDGGGGQVAIPEHIRLEFFVPDGRAMITAERNGSDTTLCRLSEDGMSLKVFLPLSRNPLGTGKLMMVMTEYSSAAGFPDDIVELHNPTEMGIMLWKGASEVGGDYGISSSIGYPSVSWSEITGRPTKLSEFENDGVFITKDELPAIDAALDAESSNAVENKAVTAALKKINDKLFPLTLSVSGGATYEKGTSHTVVIRWTLRQGDDTVTPDSVTVNGKSVDASADSYTEELVASDKNYTVACVKDGATKAATAYVRFYAPTYYGTVPSDLDAASVTEEMITVMTKTVVSGKTSITVKDVVNSKIVYAYPKAFGTVSSVKDASGFENVTAYEHAEIQIGTEPYYVYVLRNAVTITSSTQKFA